jgi:hypothetical protein
MPREEMDANLPRVEAARVASFLTHAEGVQMAKKPRLKSGFTLGGEQAEADPLLDEAFFESSDYSVIESKTDPRSFVIGRTGSGKSAALQQLEERFEGHVIRINPEDLSLPYITDLQVIRYLDELDVNLDLFWIALWKHVLLVEIIRHRYSVSGPAAKQKFLQSIRDRISRDPAKIAALDYLDEFEGRFWCETDERVREITDKFVRQVGQGAAVEAGAGSAKGRISAQRNSVQSTETRAEQADRFQRVVNLTQLAKLNKMIAVLNEDILDEQHFTYVIIDDLDRDWVDERLSNDLIRCLFRTVLDLKRVQNLKVLVALRTNIYHELEFKRRAAGQEEKVRALALQLRWTREDLQGLLDERVRAQAPAFDMSAQSLADLLPNTNRTRGNPVDYILDRTLMRPRDAIAFANECFRAGIGASRLSWEQIKSAEREYSAKRLLALRDEWNSSFPGIEEVLQKFRGCGGRITRRQLEAILDDCALLISNREFPGVRWLTEASSCLWGPGADYSWFDLYQPLVFRLYEIGFLGCAARPNATPSFFQDDPQFVNLERNLGEDSMYFVHRTYQAALDVRISGLA